MATIDLGRVGFVNKGAYSGIFAYKLNDVVVYNSGTYACIQANTGQLPTVTAYWQVWVSNDKAPLDSPALVNPTINGVAQSGYTGFKNYIINGGFDVWQRGNGDFTSGTQNCTADRWVLTGSTGIGRRDIASGGLRLFATTAGVYIGLQQRFEGGQNLSGKTITLSFERYTTVASPNGAIRLVAKKISDGTTLHTSLTALVNFGTNGGFASHSFTFTVPTFSVNQNDVMFELNIGLTNGTASTCDTTFRRIQLEEGSVATPFEQRPYGLELSLCQRYYENSADGANFSLSSTITLSVLTSTTLATGFKFNTKKRIAPTVTIYSRAGTAGKVSFTSNGADNTGTALASHISVFGCSTVAIGTASTAGNGVEAGFTASAEL